MIAFNLSMDFELGWGDLTRLARDEVFYGRVRAGLDRSPEIVAALQEYGVPSTWGVVGGCCCVDIEELRHVAPTAFAVVAEQLHEVVTARSGGRRILFDPSTVRLIAGVDLIEIGSHGFLHLVPANIPLKTLQDDVAASVRVLSAATGRTIESFIPPQNYHWPDAAFERSGVRYVRHTPRIFGRAYSDPRVGSKLARLWNDLVNPAVHTDAWGQRARLFFLRLDRGRSAWKLQLRMLRSLMASRNGSIFCYAHPHNLDTLTSLGFFVELLSVIAESRERGRLAFRRFFRELDVKQRSVGPV